MDMNKPIYISQVVCTLYKEIREVIKYFLFLFTNFKEGTQKSITWNWWTSLVVVGLISVAHSFIALAFKPNLLNLIFIVLRPVSYTTTLLFLSFLFYLTSLIVFKKKRNYTEFINFTLICLLPFQLFQILSVFFPPLSFLGFLISFFCFFLIIMHQLHVPRKKALLVCSLFLGMGVFQSSKQYYSYFKENIIDNKSGIDSESLKILKEEFKNN